MSLLDQQKYADLVTAYLVHGPTSTEFVEAAKKVDHLIGCNQRDLDELIVSVGQELPDRNDLVAHARDRLQGKYLPTCGHCGRKHESKDCPP